MEYTYYKDSPPEFLMCPLPVPVSIENQKVTAAKLRLPLGSDEHRFEGLNDNLGRYRSALLDACCVSFPGIEQAPAAEWLRTLPSKNRATMDRMISDYSPQPDAKISTACPTCGARVGGPVRPQNFFGG